MDRKTMAWDGVRDAGDRPLGGGVRARMLVAILVLWVFAVIPTGYLAAAELRGFDDTFCHTSQVCSWRYV